MGLFNLFGKEEEISKTSNVTTTTETNIRDIGFTGEQAVNLAAVIGAAQERTAAVTGTVLQNLVQKSGEHSAQLIGGANQLVNAAVKTSLPEPVKEAANGIDLKIFILFGAAAVAGYLLIKQV